MKKDLGRGTGSLNGHLSVACGIIIALCDTCGDGYWKLLFMLGGAQFAMLALIAVQAHL